MLNAFRSKRPSISTKSIRAVAVSAETSGNWPGRDPTTKGAYTTLALFHRLTQKDRYNYNRLQYFKIDLLIICDYNFRRS